MGYRMRSILERYKHPITLPKPLVPSMFSPPDFSAMAINALRNKRCGPGGSARRLHQILLSLTEGLCGGETGSTCVVKVWFLLGGAPPLPDQIQ